MFRWVTGGPTAAVLEGAASRISSKQHIGFFCSSQLAFMYIEFYISCMNDSILAYSAGAVEYADYISAEG